MNAEEQLALLEARIRPADPRSAERLAALRDALREDADAGGWIAVSPFSIVDIDEVAERLTGASSSSVVTAWMEVIRNVLILVPIVLTWLGLTYAAFGYQMAIEADPALIEQPFLVLWEQGFRGLVSGPLTLLSPLRLGVVALIDVAVVTAVVLMTIVIQREASVIRARRENEARAIRAELHDAIADASLTIASRATVPALVDAFKRASSSLIAELKAERTRLAQLGDESKRFVDDVRAAARDLRTAADGIREGASAMVPIVERIELAGTSMVNSVARIGTLEERLTAAIAAQTDELRHEHQRLAGISTALDLVADTTVRTIEGTLPAMGQALADAERELVRGFGELRQSIDEDRLQRRQLDQTLNTVAAQMTRIAASTEAMAGRHDGAAAALNQASAQLVTLADRISTVAEENRRSATDMTSSMRSIVSAIDRLARDGHER